MTDNAALALLALYHVPGIGPASLNRLLGGLPSPLAVPDCTEDELARRLGAADPQLIRAVQGCLDNDSAVRQRAQQALDWAAGHPSQNHILTCYDEDYPALLSHISCPPPVLFMKGSRAALTVPQVAVVGSRAASHYGRETTAAIVTELCRAGFGICSGLATGIDTAAHRAAVSARAVTLAVLGSGIERIYPAANESLAVAIQEQGLLISEFPLYAAPDAGHFPRRNRIISGLSLGVLVVEAAVRSGSLITARQALEQNREVFAVPGPVARASSRGCHRLLRDGAVLTETAADIVAVLSPHGAATVAQTATSPSGKSRDLPPVLPPDQQQVLACVEIEPVSMDRLVERTGLAVSKLGPILVQLELRGRIAQELSGFRRLA